MEKTLMNQNRNPLVLVPNPGGEGRSVVDIEALGTADLFRHPYVNELFNNCLFFQKECFRLQKELNLHESKAREFLERHALENSLIPALRPSHYPQEIIWDLADIGPESDVHLVDGDEFWQPTVTSIRHEDGSQISDSGWLAIKKTALELSQNLLALPNPHEHTRIQRSRKDYFQYLYPTQWEKAIRKLETDHPLLALCAAHWKAERILGDALAWRYDGFPQSAKEGKKRSGQSESQGPKRNKRKRVS